jgi:catechol 2,3-dioxygenase-like lactoylglutathione lyase family enzyme
MTSILSDGPIIAFVATTQPDKARAFYKDVLGLHLTSEDQFALAFDLGGTMLRVARVEQLQPASYTVLGFVVADIHAAIEELTRSGVEFERFSFMQQDDHGVWTAPGGAKIAWFKDPDANTLSLTQW